MRAHKSGIVHAGWVSLWDMLARRESDFARAQRERFDFKRRWFAEIDAIVADRRRQPPAGGARDLLDLPMNARTTDGAPALNDREISDQVATMMAAGFETTHAMFWTIYLLAADGTVQDEVRAELLATPANSVRTLSGLRAWPALRRVLLEALRLYPPFPVTARVASQDDVVGGVAIKAGTLVMLSAWIIHRLRRFWASGKPRSSSRAAVCRPKPSTSHAHSRREADGPPAAQTFLRGRSSMRLQTVLARAAALGLAGIVVLTCAVQAAEIRVVSSGGFAAAYKTLAPEFERQTGHTLATGWGPSMGTTLDAVPSRLARGEPVDVLIMVGYALGKLVDEGKVAADSRADLARSGIGVVVRAGSPSPDISSVDALRRTLLAAKSIAYSDSASGVYIQNEMFKRMGIAEQMAGKARMIPAEPVGAVVARGEAEIGFQQISELKPIAGIVLVGPLPPEVQQFTIFSSAVVVGSREPEAARALIRFLASPSAASAIVESGMEPMGTKVQK